jgi:large subunit ribosomal protein L29
MPLRSDEIRDMTDGDINARVAELEEERFRLKFRSATEPLENPLRLRTIRRDIARLKTILRERQLAATGGARAGRGR